MASPLSETETEPESAADGTTLGSDSSATSASPSGDDATDAASSAEYGACPVVHSLDQIGSQWRLIVLYELLDGERRFNELKRATDANARTLSRVLDDLGERGFVDRRLEEDAPVATYYSLTKKGESLEGVFAEIECWASEWLDESAYDAA